MARIRSIHPEICESESLDAVSAEAERTFVRLMPHCDDEGRAKADAKLLRSRLYPRREDITSVDVERWLKELVGVRSIIYYTVDEVLYLVIPNFKNWQNPRHPTASKLPEPPEGYDNVAATTPLQRSAVDLQPFAEQRTPEFIGGEGSCNGEKRESAEVAQQPQAARSLKKSIPDRLTVSPFNEVWGMDHGFTFDEVQIEASKMLDYHRSVDKPSADWNASLRTWLSRDKRYFDVAPELRAFVPVDPDYERSRLLGELQQFKELNDTGAYDDDIADVERALEAIPA